MCNSYYSEDDILKELEELSLEAQGGKAEKEPPAVKVNSAEQKYWKNIEKTTECCYS